MRDKFTITEEISVYSGALKLLRRFDEVRNDYGGRVYGRSGRKSENLRIHIQRARRV